MKLERKLIFTIPNLLSLFRLMLIPVFVLLYLNGKMEWTAALLILSGLTDVMDGMIARKFNQISDVGKVFDPIADKLTQAAMLLCLIKHFPMMLVPFLLMIVKELLTVVSGLIVIRRIGIVPGSAWHGKLTTFMLYGLMIVHVVWQDIPVWMSNMFTIGVIIMMIISLALYTARNICFIRAAADKDAASRMGGTVANDFKAS